MGAKGVVKFWRLWRRRARVWGRDEALKLAVLAVPLGFAGAYAAIAIRKMIELVTDFWVQAPEWDQAIGATPWWVYLAAPTLAGVVIGWIMHRVMPAGGLRGVPGVIADVLERAARIDRRQWITDGVAAPLAIGSGVSLGREGPTVAIGAALASELARWFRFAEAEARILVGCGVAAGIAASFNTPIAGVLFAVEVILHDFAIATFTPIVISAVIATIISRAVIGDFPAFMVPEYHLISAGEMLVYLAIGLASGLVAAAWIRMLGDLRVKAAKLAPDVRVRAPLAGLCVGIIGIVLPQAVSIGYGVVEQMMLEELDPQIFGWQVPLVAFLGLLLAMKFAATVISVAGGLPGGLLGPSLFLGATIGAAIGAAAHAAAPLWTESYGAYALVGCAALTGAAMHAPLTTMLMVFEMTADYHIMLPLMLATVVATLVARRLSRASVFTEALIARGIETEGGVERAWLRAVSVRRIPWRSLPTVAEDAPLEEVKEVYVRSGKGVVGVLDGEGKLVGIVTFSDLQPHLLDKGENQGLSAADICNR
ncbi:MAG: chloride channel protein, partial [Zetaproteobacteria bacterium]